MMHSNNLHVLSLYYMYHSVFTVPTPVVPAVYFIDDTSTVLKIITLVEADNAEAFRVQAEEIVKVLYFIIVFLLF